MWKSESCEFLMTSQNESDFDQSLLVSLVAVLIPPLHGMISTGYARCWWLLYQNWAKGNFLPEGTLELCLCRHV